MIRCAFLLLLVSLVISTPAVGVDNIDVYILTGQSNSLGTTALEGAEADYRPASHVADQRTAFFWSNVSPRNRVFPPTPLGDSGGSLTSLRMQQGDGGANPNFWGPEFGFARAMYEQAPDQKRLIIIR